MPDGAWLDDTPEARMDRIKELLLMKPRQTYGREVRSPQHKAARRLGLPVPEGAPTPQQPPHTAAVPVYRPPAAPPVSALFATDVFEKLQSMATMQPPPGKASVEEEPQSPERSVTVSRYADATAASVSASSSLVVSLKLQNENLRVALQRATEEAAACRTAQLVQESASFDKDCMKDRDFIGSQEQYYRDYIMVERAVEERESSWTTAVRAMESQQQDTLHAHRRAAAEWKIQEANLTTTARLLEEQVEVLSAQLAEAAAAASVPAVAPPPPTSPARALVTGMRDELLQLRRQWNDDRTAHHRERGLWERERADLIEALRIQKDVATAAEKVRGRASQEPQAAGLASEEAPKAEQPIPEGDRTALAAVADMERRMKAREKKAQRAALFRERDFAAARVELEKDEASRRSILDFEEDMLRKELTPPTPPAPRQATSSPQRHWPASELADGAGAAGAPPQTHIADTAPRQVSTEALAALPSMVGELIQQSLASGALPPELLRTILAGSLGTLGTAPGPSPGHSVSSEARAPSVPASVSVDTCGPRECTPLEEVEEGVPNPYSAEPVDSRTSAAATPAATPEPQQRSAVALTDLLSSQMQDFRRLSEHPAREVGPPPTPDQQLPAATLVCLVLLCCCNLL